jgi:catalase
LIHSGLFQAASAFRKTAIAAAGRSAGSAPTPNSFAEQEYHGIDAFIFVDKAGHRQAVRYIMTPEKAVPLTPEEAARKPADFLVDDLPRRIEKRPVVFHLKAQLAAAGDHTKDPSQPWPDDRKVVDLGTLTLDTPVDTLEAQKKLLFLPNRLTDGIEISDDRLPVIRSEVYVLAFARRSR